MSFRYNISINFQNGQPVSYMTPRVSQMFQPPVPQVAVPYYQLSQQRHVPLAKKAADYAENVIRENPGKTAAVAAAIPGAYYLNKVLSKTSGQKGTESDFLKPQFFPESDFGKNLNQKMSSPINEMDLRTQNPYIASSDKMGISGTGEPPIRIASHSNDSLGVKEGVDSGFLITDNINNPDLSNLKPFYGSMSSPYKVSSPIKEMDLRTQNPFIVSSDKMGISGTGENRLSIYEPQSSDGISSLETKGGATSGSAISGLNVWNPEKKIPGSSSIDYPSTQDLSSGDGNPFSFNTVLDWLKEKASSFSSSDNSLPTPSPYLDYPRIPLDIVS